MARNADGLYFAAVIEPNTIIDETYNNQVIDTELILISYSSTYQTYQLLFA